MTRVAIAMATGVVVGTVGYMVLRVAMAMGTIVLCIVIAHVCLPEIEKGSAMGGCGSRVSQWPLECVSIAWNNDCLLGSNVNASPL